MEKSKKGQQELEDQLLNQIETEPLLESIAFLKAPLKLKIGEFLKNIIVGRNNDFYDTNVVLLAWFRLYSLVPECRTDIMEKLIPWLSEAIEETFDDISQGINIISSIVDEGDFGQVEFLRAIKEVEDSCKQQ